MKIYVAGKRKEGREELRKLKVLVLCFAYITDYFILSRQQVLGFKFIFFGTSKH